MKKFIAFGLKVSILFSLILIISLSAEANDNEFKINPDGSIDIENRNPTLFHKWLAEGKARALRDKWDAQEKSLDDYISTTQTEYDVKFYDINIRVNDTIYYIYGAVKIVAEATTDNVQIIEIDYDDYYLMYVDSIVHPQAGVLSYNRIDNIVAITLPQAVNTGEQFEFTFYYHGHPNAYLGSLSWREYEGRPVIYSSCEPYGSRVWWPCKDRPDDKADSFYIAITVDTSMYVGSNGTLDSIVEHGDNSHTFFYTEHYPMATYLFSIAVSDYLVWYDEWVYNDGLDTMPIVNAVFPEVYNGSLGLEVTPYALDVLSENYGLYPYADEKYGHSAWLWDGAMEHQTMTSTTATNYYGWGYWGFSEPIVVHELAHQWWGDYITCENFHHIWLNEGFASYSEALYYYVKEGWYSYRSYMTSMEYFGGGTIYVADTTSEDLIFHVGLVYDKGAWVVHMLRGVLGDSLFFEGITAYYNSEFAHGSATTEDFRDVFEDATGVELDWFFEEWIYGLYFPQYEYSIWEEESDTNGFDYFVQIEQTQQSLPQIFHNPIQFTFTDSGQIYFDTAVFNPEYKNEVFRVNFSDRKYFYRLDPARWILKKTTYKDWNIHILTMPGELNSGIRGVPYLDTIEYRSIEPVTEVVFVIRSLPNGLTIDNQGIISGAPTKSGEFDFYMRYLTETGQKSETYKYYINIEPVDYLAGDIDLNGSLDVGDLLYLVEYMFLEGPAPFLNDITDVDNSCQVDIADLVYLAEYQFIGGPEPVIGCAE